MGLKFISKGKKTIEKNLLILLTKNDTIKYLVILARDRILRRSYKKKYAKKFKTQENLVVFISYWGKQYSCNPRALYEEMLTNPAYSDYRMIWVLENPEKYAFLSKNPRTFVVPYRSEAFYRAFAKAKIWVSNCRIPNELCPREDQIYLQTWHGTPLKKLGFDIEQYRGVRAAQKELQYEYRTDASRYSYLLSPSSFYKEKLTSAFRLSELQRKRIFIDSCYPRNDFLFQKDINTIRKIQQRLQLPEGRRVILYAPTWRETSHDSINKYQYNLEVHFDRWREVLGETAVILFRSHYMISNAIDLSLYKGFVWNVTEYDDIRELYLISDLLITDYSSVFFDYANLERPMLFYMYDYEEYKHELRGFYIDEEELPGKIVKTEEELLSLLLDYDGSEYRERYVHFNQKFNPYRDGKGSETVWRTVLSKQW